MATGHVFLTISNSRQMTEQTKLSPSNMYITTGIFIQILILYKLKYAEKLYFSKHCGTTVSMLNWPAAG